MTPRKTASVWNPLGTSTPVASGVQALVVTGLLALTFAGAALADPAISEDPAPDLLTAVGSWEKAGNLGSEAAVRGLAVEVRSDLLERGTERFRFQDFHARAFEAELERLDRPVPGGTTWVGRVSEFGEHSQVLLSTYGGAVSGYLDTPEARYEILPRPGGHVMVELDPSRFAGCGTSHEDGDHDHNHDISAEERREAAATLGLDPSSLESQLDGKASLFSILEVAVLYTEEVEEVVGGSEGLFSTVFSALGVLNQSFFNSAIPAMAQLVGLEETEQLGNTASGYDGLALVLFGDGSEFSSENEVELYENRPDFDGQSENGDSFGQAMARGDFDNDGYDDLAIGVPGETLSSGTLRSTGLVWILYGSADGFDFDRTRKFHQNSSGMPDSNESGDLFGWSLAVGNFDGDHHDDLAIGVPYETVGGHEDAGRVQILYGTGGGLTTFGSLSIDQDDLSGEASEEDDHFGWALTSGDFDDDGYDDLAIGTPDQDRTVGGNTTHSVGRVAVVYGSEGGLDPDESDAFEQGSSGVGDSPESWDRLGAVLASGDFDDDGYDDLAMGVPFDNQASGLLHILFGTASGLTGTDSSTLTHSDAGGVPADRDNFGSSLAVGDLNGDSIDDLVVGVPLKDKGNKEDAGEVNLFYGRSPWVVTTGSRIQGIQDNAQFGFGLATADLDGDGYDDLLASEPYYDYKRGKKAEKLNSGQVWVINGGANTLSIGGTWAQQTSGVAGSPEKNDLLGYTLLLGDFDNDGNPDLVAGVPAEGVSNDSDYFKKWLGAKSRVSEFREETGADLVGLLVEDLEDACGSAQDIPETTAGDSTVYYQVTDRSCAVGHMTFAHEIGHLIGLGHDPGNGGGTCDDAHGHFVDQKGRTVMSYLDNCTDEKCPREARFSEPDLDFSFGDPTGIDGARDNARCARLTVPNVAAYN